MVAIEVLCKGETRLRKYNCRKIHGMKARRSRLQVLHNPYSWECIYCENIYCEYIYSENYPRTFETSSLGFQEFRKFSICAGFRDQLWSVDRVLLILAKISGQFLVHLRPPKHVRRLLRVKKKKHTHPVMQIKIACSARDKRRCRGSEENPPVFTQHRANSYSLCRSISWIKNSRTYTAKRIKGNTMKRMSQTPDPALFYANPACQSREKQSIARQLRKMLTSPTEFGKGEGAVPRKWKRR